MILSSLLRLLSKFSGRDHLFPSVRVRWAAVKSHRELMIFVSARANRRLGFKAEANRRQPVGSLEPLQGRQQWGEVGRMNRRANHPQIHTYFFMLVLKRRHQHLMNYFID